MDGYEGPYVYKGQPGSLQYYRKGKAWFYMDWDGEKLRRLSTRAKSSKLNSVWVDSDFRQGNLARAWRSDD